MNYNNRLRIRIYRFRTRVWYKDDDVHLDMQKIKIVSCILRRVLNTKAQGWFNQSTHLVSSSNSSSVRIDDQFWGINEKSTKVSAKANLDISRVNFALLSLKSYPFNK